MKKFLSAYFVFLTCCIFAQQPAVGSITVLPALVTPNTPVKIVTTVTTPAQGVLVDKSFTVSQNPDRIELRICYGYGLLPATFAYVDTFNVGVLPAGNYALHFRAYMSSANQWCNKIDSNEVSATLTVNVSTEISEHQNLNHSIFVTEAGNTLKYNCGDKLLQIEIYNMDGKLETRRQVSGNGSIDLHDLTAGMYLLRYVEVEKLRRIKFIKE